jgi:uncharacterized protein (DUF2147 family)
MKILKALMIGLLFMVSTSYAASPQGYWKTIDDVTGKVKSIIKIEGTDELSGTVVKLFPGALTVCTACKGNLKNKPILGMTVMSGLEQNPEDKNEWIDGTIMDPKNGETYNCKLSVSPDGNRLNVRGYFGVSVFGRTQTWVRASGR